MAFYLYLQCDIVYLMYCVQKLMLFTLNVVLSVLCYILNLV